MKPAIGLILGMALALGSGGCKKKEDVAQTAAGGELLPRSVGDEMISYDTIRSQAPLAAPDTMLPSEGAGHPKAQASDAADENADVVTPAEPAAAE